jgi:predicted TIM-barrel fold metal-dependent hydrolase
MSRTAIISVDGHVKASRAGYRDYVEQQYLDDFDRWLQAAEEAGLPDAGNLNPAFGVDAQWDSDKRLRELESVGVVAEVLFPNGQPFQVNRLEDFGRMQSPELAAAGRQAYNRWLADFCAQVPGRRAGQAVISFDDIDQAVNDVQWAKEHGLGGIMMPPLNPGGIFFFDPVLDPVWRAIQDVGLPISQHGGSGAPAYSPPGFASIITLAMEHSFFSGRSLSQLMVGGVFDRFPDLQIAFVETEAYWMGPMITRLEQFVGLGSDWMGFARSMSRDTTMSRTPREYWASNCHAGLSPFSSSMVSIEDLALGDDGPESEFFTRSEFFISADKAMFGVDYPHFESILPSMTPTLAELLGHPAITDEIARKILFDNAAELYGFDPAALQPHVERVGFEPGQVLASTST